MKHMNPTLKIAAFFMLLLGLAFASSVKNDFGHCERVVKRWVSSSLDQDIKEDKHALRDLLFFLHIPRTGGRTYFHCFLKKLYSSSDECPRSYDKLRFDPSKQKCRLLVTHDDYSLISKLPREKTSVVTILRDPTDRVFSTYEFSIEVAARFLVHPNLTSATQMAGRIRSKTTGVSTLDIWPWKYLVPWMREDLFVRRDARKLRGIDHIESKDPYNMQEMAMPLDKYINDPVAHDIVHNGATFQIAGLTNNSYLPESHEVRHCVQKYKILGQHVLRVAKRRLDNMLYVGITEDHRESATMFANVVGAQVISQLVASNSTTERGRISKSEQSSSFSDSEPDNIDNQSNTSANKATQIASTENTAEKSENITEMTVEQLMELYGTCISSLRKTQARRRTNSLMRISPANFSKEARRQVRDSVIQQIRTLNNLDLELYEYARDIFKKQHKQATSMTLDKWENMLKDLDAMKLWKILAWSMPVMLLFFSFVFVSARRRTSKVKI